MIAFALNPPVIGSRSRTNIPCAPGVISGFPIFSSPAICEKQLGASHPDTGTILNNLAELYKRQGRYAEAESHYRQATSIVVAGLGAQHPCSISVMRNHMAILQEMGRLEAELPSLPTEYIAVLESMDLENGASNSLIAN